MFNFFKSKNKEENIKEFDLYAMTDGKLISIDQVSDPVFSQKMMGDGFAIIPDSGNVYAPCDADVLNIFPSKHAIALKNGEVEILLHLGIDTVSLNGEPFDIKISEGDKVNFDTELVDVNINDIKVAEKDPVMMVVFTNGNDTIKSFELFDLENIKKGDKIGKIILK